MESRIDPRKPSWFDRLFGEAEESVMVTLGCDALRCVELDHGADAADHVRRILVRHLGDTLPEDVEVLDTGSEISFIAPLDTFDPNLWTIRVETLIRETIHNAGYPLEITFDVENAQGPAFDASEAYLR